MAMAARMPMMIITTSSSISENPHSASLAVWARRSRARVAESRLRPIPLLVGVSGPTL